MPPVDFKQPGHHTGHRHRAHANVELLPGGAEIRQNGVEVELFRAAFDARGLHEKIVHRRRLTGLLRHQETAATQAGQHRLRHACNTHGAQHCVKRVALLFEQARCCFRCFLVARGRDPGMLRQFELPSPQFSKS